MMLFMYNVVAFAALHILFVKGDSSQNAVFVGLEGGTYSPPTVVVAAANNSITFEFYGSLHSVTQSSFEDPCALLPGGFHSGYLGMEPNATGVLVWDLFITDVSAPIYFFCAAVSPSFHCKNGMVGAINVQSQAEYTSFSAAAIAVTTTANVNSSPVLSGVNAFATDTPTVSVLPFTPVSTPLTSSTSQSKSTPTSTSATSTSTTSNLGAIVGGTVGGTIALTTFIVSLWYFCLRNKRAPATVQNDEISPFNPVPAQHLNEVFAGTVGSGHFNHNSSNTKTSTPSLTPLRRPSGPIILDPPYLHQQSSKQSDLTPLRRPSGPIILDPPYLHQQSSQQSDLTPLRRPSGPVILEPPYLHQQTSQQSDLTPLRRPSGPVIPEPYYLHQQMSQQSDLTPLQHPSGTVIPYLHPQTSQQSDLASTSSNPTTTSGRNLSNQSNNIDIRALAQEVAAVLYQNPPASAMNYSPDPPRRVQMSVVRNQDYANSSQLTHQPPSSYRTDPNSSSSSIGLPRRAPYT